MVFIIPYSCVIINIITLSTVDILLPSQLMVLSFNYSNFTEFFLSFSEAFYFHLKNNEDILYKMFKNYHQNMKVIIKIIPTKFLGTNSNCVHRIYKNMVHKKTTKL